MKQLLLHTEDHGICKTEKTGFLFIPVLGGLIVAFFFTGLVLLNIINYGSPYDARIAVAAAVILACWTIAFICACGNKHVALKHIGLVCLTFVALAIYLSHTVWGSNYLSLDIYKRIAEGSVHYDTLYLSSIAQSVKQFSCPVFFVNGITSFGYHFGSNAWIGIIAALIGIPVPFAYYYVFPMLAIPLYFFLILFDVMSLRAIWTKDAEPFSLLDALIIGIFFVGVLPLNAQSSMGIWRTSWIVSESFVVACIVVLTYIALTTVCYRNNLFRKRWAYLCWILGVTPAFIVAAFLSKISVGVLMCGGIMYFFFRTQTRNWRYWLLNLLYLMIAAAYYLYISSLGTETTALTVGEIQWLSFWKVYAPTLPYALSIIALLAFSIVAAYLSFRKVHSIREAVLCTDYVFAEILVAIAIVGCIPAMLFNIYGGSAVYFSYPQRLLALLLLLGNQYPNRVYKKCVQSEYLLHRVFAKVAVIILVIAIISNTPFSGFLKLVKQRACNSDDYDETFKPGVVQMLKAGEIVPAFQRVASLYFDHTKYGEASIIRNLDRIAEETRANPKAYCIFLDESAEAFETYSTRIILFLYPSYTGVMLENVLYLENGQYYYRNGLLASPYVLGVCDGDIFPSEPKMSLQEVVEKARSDGREYVIHLFEDKMEIIPVAQQQ